MSASLRFRVIQVLGVCAVLLTLSVGSTATAATPLTFSAAFDNSTIGRTSTATLTFTMTNIDAIDPAANVAFALTLPAGVTLATPASASTSCTDAILVAFDAGASVDLSGGRLGTSNSCTVSVDVTSATVATHSITTGDLTSSSGNSGPTTADLFVVANRAGIAMSFAPGTVPVNGTTTMVVTFDNSLSGGFDTLFVNVPLGLGISVAQTANATQTCASGTVTATPSATSVTFSGFLLANETCVFTVDVTASIGGMISTTSGQLATQQGAAGKASALLDVEVSPLNLGAFFVDAPVPPGGTVTLEYTITNFHPNAATDISFTNDLDATMTGLTAVDLPATPCGVGSALVGTSILSLSGGSLAAGTSCTFSVTLQVPGGAAPASYTNSTTAVNATIDGMSVAGSIGTDVLDIATVPTITKSYTDDPTAAGGTVIVEYTITNTNTASAATDVTFEDNLDDLVPSIVAVLPMAGFCGAGATMFTGPVVGPLGANGLVMSGGDLAAGASCTFQVSLQLDSETPNGTHSNTTGGVGATIDGTTVIGLGGTDTLLVVTAPQLSVSFTDDPVTPGGTVTLEMTLSYDENTPANGTGVGFSIDLDAVIAGLAATGLPVADVCGAGSQLSGTSTLSLSGATLSANASCTFSVVLQVPVAAAAGDHLVSSTTVTGTSLAVAVTSRVASDTLVISGMVVQKEFIDDPALPGGTVSVQYTITNAIPGETLTNISFTDDLGAALSGMTALALPASDACGAGSVLSGTNVITLAAGQLADAASCTFTVQLQVPAAASAGKYPSVTSAITADTSTTTVTVDAASDTLIVADPLMFSAEFINDPVLAGGTVTLQFTIANADATNAATALSFSDDLDAALAGLTVTGLPINDVCGVGSQLTGTDVLTLSGGNLAAGAMCTFNVTLQLPTAVDAGAVVTNTTSMLSGTIDGSAVTQQPASDTLFIDLVTATKSFADTVTPGGTATLTIVIENHSSRAIADISLLDKLETMAAGAIATGLPLSNVCGVSSELSGDGTITLRTASLAGSATCSFDVQVLIPAATALGDYENVTGEVTAATVRIGDVARATLTVVPIAPAFSKAFAPATISPDAVSTLTFMLDNTASTVAATGVSMTDNLPSGMVIASPANATTDCTDGTLGASAGMTSIRYTAGTIAALTACTMSVDVAVADVGTYDNVTEDMTSSSGSSGIASASLIVQTSPDGPDAGGGSGGDGGGCCDAGDSSTSSGLLAMLLFALLAQRRRRVAMG